MVTGSVGNWTDWPGEWHCPVILKLTTEVGGRMPSVTPGSWTCCPQTHRGGEHCRWPVTQVAGGISPSASLWTCTVAGESAGSSVSFSHTSPTLIPSVHWPLPTGGDPVLSYFTIWWASRNQLYYHLVGIQKSVIYPSGEKPEQNTTYNRVMTKDACKRSTKEMGKFHQRLRYAL